MCLWGKRWEVLKLYANPNKCQVILEMRSSRNMKEVQRLADRIALLTRFLLRITKRAKLIMNLLKKTKKIEWNDECEEIFR